MVKNAGDILFRVVCHTGTRVKAAAGRSAKFLKLYCLYSALLNIFAINSCNGNY
jgi:hypothetical protein